MVPHYEHVLSPVASSTPSAATDPNPRDSSHMASCSAETVPWASASHLSPTTAKTHYQRPATGTAKIKSVSLIRGVRSMRTVFLALRLCVLATCVVAQQPSKPDQSTRKDGVVQRGDHVMGFLHDLTTHHFRLLKDGGEIIVTANSPNDKSSIDEIRAHLTHISKMFSDGNFDAPMLIHDANPPGVATMVKLKNQIQYQVSEVDRGGKIRIFTTSPETIDAVHAFLLFQIVDHQTGDVPTIGS